MGVGLIGFSETVRDSLVKARLAPSKADLQVKLPRHSEGDGVTGLLEAFLAAVLRDPREAPSLIGYTGSSLLDLHVGEARQLIYASFPISEAVFARERGWRWRWWWCGETILWNSLICSKLQIRLY